MARSWSVAKPLVVRPFPEIKDALKATTFRLGPDRAFESRDTYESREVNVASLQPEFQFGLNGQHKFTRGLSLVVSLQDNGLRRNEVTFETKLQDAPDTYQVPVDVVRRFGWKAGVRAVVSIIQEEETKQQDGKPWMRGHWVARRVFTIGAKPKARAFPIESWKPEEFKRRKLPEGTVYWLDLTTPDLNQKFKEPGQAFRLGIREDVYEALAVNQDAAGTKAAFAMLVADTVTDLFMAGLDALDGEEVVHGGVMDTLLKRMHRATGLTRENLDKLRKRDDGRAQIRAYVQTMQSTAQPLLRLRRGG